MAAEEGTPTDVTSLREYRRTDRQAAFTRIVPGYMLKVIPVISANAGELYLYVYEEGAQGPLYKSPFPIDDETREALDLPEEVMQVGNQLLEMPFEWPAALA